MESQMSVLLFCIWRQVLTEIVEAAGRGRCGEVPVLGSLRFKVRVHDLENMRQPVSLCSGADRVCSQSTI